MGRATQNVHHTQLEWGSAHNVQHTQLEWGSAHYEHHKQLEWGSVHNVHHSQLEWSMQYIEYITNNMIGAQHIMDIAQK